MAKKPCLTCDGVGGGEEGQGSCTTCGGTGQVWLLPGLQKECKGNVQSSSTALHELCCDGSGWQPILFDALALMDAIDGAGWPGIAIRKIGEKLFCQFLGLEPGPWWPERAQNRKAALIGAAYKALGLEESDAGT